MKRSIALSLSMILLFGAFSTCAAAAGAGTEPGPSAAAAAFEKAGGALGSLLGRLVKLITFTDESRIKKAEARDAAGQASDTALFSGAAEQTLTAETWRAVELSFESETTYADPFADVTLDLLLWGNGRL